MTERTAECAELIRRNRMLAQLSDDALTRLAAGAERVFLAPGEVLYSRRDPASRLFVVLAGHVELFLDDDSGIRTRTDMVAAPHSLALICALDGGAYAYTCEGGGSGAELLALPAADFIAELPAHPMLVRQLLAETSARLRRLVGQLSDLKLRDSVQRLAGYIVDLSPERDGAVEITLPSEKRLVADRLGMQPETLSRALARLEALGLAHPADAATLRVPDLSNLRRLYLTGDKGLAS